MAINSSPLPVMEPKVRELALTASTYRNPWMTVPAAASGVMVTVIVPVWPGASVSGV
jgi:hypothetical protein